MTSHDGACLNCGGPLDARGVCIRCAAIAAGRAMTDCYFYPRELAAAVALVLGGLFGFAVVGWLIVGSGR